MIRFKILPTIIFDSRKYAVLRDEEKLERYNKIWWKFYKIEKIRQGFYKDKYGNVYAGYIKSESNFHYMMCRLKEHLLCASDCKHLTPIRFEEGLELWKKERIKALRKDYVLKSKKSKKITKNKLKGK